jgi:hypothetical protein
VTGHVGQLVGGGTPFFSHDERRVGLVLLYACTFRSGVIYLRYRVAR